MDGVDFSEDVRPEQFLLVSESSIGEGIVVWDRQVTYDPVPCPFFQACSLVGGVHSTSPSARRLLRVVLFVWLIISFGFELVLESRRSSICGSINSSAVGVVSEFPSQLGIEVFLPTNFVRNGVLSGEGRPPSLLSRLGTPGSSGPSSLSRLTTSVTVGRSGSVLVILVQNLMAKPRSQSFSSSFGG